MYHDLALKAAKILYDQGMLTRSTEQLAENGMTGITREQLLERAVDAILKGFGVK